MSFIDNLDALLAQRHLTQEEVARAAGVTPGAVSGWRNGSVPRRATIRRLCDAFGLREDDLVSDSAGLSARLGAGAAQGGQVSIPLISGINPERECASAQRRIEVPARIVRDRPNAYAVTAKDDGMSCVIPVGSHVVIDPEDLCPENGTPVAFKFVDLQLISELWTSGERIQFRRWYVGVSHLMLTPQSYRDKIEDLVLRLEEADSSIELLGAVVWFQAAEGQ